MPNATHERGLLVAETDEDGRIIHVWIKDDHARHPRPFRALRTNPDAALDRYGVSGARREDVATWLTSRH